jgi:hypothetical protein
MKNLVPIILLFLSFGCEELTNTTDYSTHYMQWQSQNIHNYTIEQARYCFCPDGGQKVQITIRADSVYSVLRIADSMIIPYPNLARYLTIDSLFAIIENNESDSLVVEYDSIYGYPTKLDINPQLHPVDGGILYETANLRIIK